MKTRLLILPFLISFRLFPQCDCPASFDWMVKTFEQNDAGFQYVIDKKGKEDYAKHTEVWKEKAVAAKTYENCHVVLNEWLRYFRTGHIGVQLKNVAEGSKDKAKSSDQEIREMFKNTKQVELTEKDLIRLLENKKTKDPIKPLQKNTMGLLLKLTVFTGCQNR
jgi:hypothetical protein